MKVAIVSQYRHVVIARALRKVFTAFGLHCNLMRFSSTLDEDVQHLESDAFLILLPPYWEIQPSFILPLFKLVANAPDEAKKLLPRKCFVISVGTAPFIRPYLRLNLVEILAALGMQSPRSDLQISQLDQSALLDLVAAIASVVRHCEDPRMWADFLTLLIPFRHCAAFGAIQSNIQASLTTERNRRTLAGIAGFLDPVNRETIVSSFFPSEAVA